MRALGAVLLAAAVCAPAMAETQADVTKRIGDTAGVVRRHLDLVAARDPATRLAAFHEMVRSGSPLLAEAAIGAALQSEDATLAALGLRAAMVQVRALVARLETGAAPSAEAQAVIQACGSAANYRVDKYSYDTATFEVRGQDQVGAGNVSGATLTMTLEYGCSFSGRLGRDGVLTGIVSAPYKKGALPARIMLR